MKWLLLGVVIAAAFYFGRYSVLPVKVYHFEDANVGMTTVECRSSLIPGEWQRCRIGFALAAAQEAEGK